MLRRMDEMLGLAPQLSLEAHGELRGQKLQEIAVELLRQEEGAGVAVHYRDWFELLSRPASTSPARPPRHVLHPGRARAPGRVGRPRSGSTGSAPPSRRESAGVRPGRCYLWMHVHAAARAATGGRPDRRSRTEGDSRRGEGQALGRAPAAVARSAISTCSRTSSRPQPVSLAELAHNVGRQKTRRLAARPRRPADRRSATRPRTCFCSAATTTA